MSEYIHKNGSLFLDKLVEAGFYLLLLFTPLALGTVQPWSWAVLETGVFLLAGLWFFRGLRRGYLEFIKNPLNWPILILLAISLCQVFIHFDPLPYFSPDLTLASPPRINFPGTTVWQVLPSSIYAWASRAEFFKFLTLALAFTVFINTFQTKRRLSRLVLFLVFFGLGLSLFGLIQTLSGTAKVFWLMTIPPYFHRFFGPFLAGSHFAGYIGMIIPLALGALFSGIAKTARGLLIFSIIIMGLALVFTYSRGGVIALIGSLIIFTLLVLSHQKISAAKKRSPILWIILPLIALIVLGAFWLGSGPLLEKFSRPTGLTHESRWFIWRDTIAQINSFPIWGVGLGAYQYLFPRFQGPEIRGLVSHAHNDYLELLAEAGWLGFLVVLWAGLAYLIKVIRMFYIRRSPWAVYLTAGGLAGLGAICIHSFFDFNLHIGANAFLLAIFLGLTLNISHLSAREKETEGQEKLVEEKMLLGKIHFSVAQKLLTLYYLLMVAAVASLSWLAIKPALAHHYLARAEAAFPSGERIIWLKKAVRFDPGNAFYHYQLAESSKEASQSEYGKAVFLNPAESRYHQSLAWLYGRLDQPEEARRQFSQAILLEPNNPYRYRSFAVWCFSQPSEENIRQGIKAYQTAVILEPSLSQEAVESYYRVCGDLGKTAEMVLPLEDCVLAYSSLLFRAGQEQKGFAYLEDFLKKHPDSPWVHFHLADRAFYRKDHSWEYVQNHYRQALALDPDNDYFRFWHGLHLYYRGFYDEAIKELDQAFTLNPKNQEAKDWLQKAKAKTIK